MGKTDAKAKMVNDGVVIVPKLSTEPEHDWETDPDYINAVTEESQRWGGARDTGAMDMDKFREEMVKEADNATKKNKSEFARVMVENLDLNLNKKTKQQMIVK